MSASDPEHDFAEQVLLYGENLRSYTASEDIDAHQAVEVTDDYEVSVASEDGDCNGVAMYDVASGQEVAVAGDSCEVRVEADGELSAGDAVAVGGSGNFKQSTSEDDSIGVVIAGASDGGLADVELNVSTGEVSA